MISTVVLQSYFLPINQVIVSAPNYQYSTFRDDLQVLEPFRTFGRVIPEVINHDVVRCRAKD